MQDQPDSVTVSVTLSQTPRSGDRILHALSRARYARSELCETPGVPLATNEHLKKHVSKEIEDQKFIGYTLPLLHKLQQQD